MITSGENFRSVSLQSGGIVNFRTNFQNSVGDFQIGLSGSNFFGVSCDNGMLSVEGVSFGSINNGSKDFSIKYSNDYFDLLENGVSILNGISKTSGIYDNLVINSSENIDTDFFLSGLEPSLALSILNNSNSGQPVISGLLTNSFPERGFKIFNAEVDTKFSSKFSVSGWDSGLCYDGCNFTLNSLENNPFDASGIKINFDSNFGNFSLIANVFSDFSGNSQVFSVSPNSDTFFDSAGSKFFNITSFYQGANRNLQVSLSYESGGLTDQLRSLESGSISGTVSGFIEGCGTIYGTHSQTINDVVGLSGYTFSGLATGELSATFCHTGDITLNTSVYKSGIIPSGPNAGNIIYVSENELFSGVVLGGSGSYLFQETVTGYFLTGGVNVPVTGYVDETSYLYSTEGRIAGIGTSGLNQTSYLEICGDYLGTSLITSYQNYYYNSRGWSGYLPTLFSGVYEPVGVYTEDIFVTGYGLNPYTLETISGLLSGTISGYIDNGSGYDILEGSLYGSGSYFYSGCFESGTRLVETKFPAVTPLYDGYDDFPSGYLNDYNFSTIREYLQGSGLPCELYLSGYIYTISGYPQYGINEIPLRVHDRSNNSLITTVVLDEFVRNITITDLDLNEIDYAVYRKSVPELLSFNLTGDINIYGSVVSTTDEETNSIITLSLIPYVSGTQEGFSTITGDYSVEAYLTGTVCLEGSGHSVGDVSGVLTSLEATGIGSGLLRGPQVPVSFSDIWNLVSGDGQYSYDFKASGWFDGGPSGEFYNASAAMVTRQNFFNKPFVEVYYDRGLNGETSVARLSIFDEYNSEEILISGK